MSAEHADELLAISTGQEAELALPEGWASVSLGDIMELKYGKALPEMSREGGPISVYGSNGIVGFHSGPLTKGPTLIVGRKGTVGAVHYSPEPCWPIDTTYFIDDFHGLDPCYILYALCNLNLGRLDTSTAIPGLNRHDAYAELISVAPLDEQKRIVERMDKLLDRMVDTRSRLAKAGAILNRFRQSVLVAACSGRLTADWRGEQSSIEPAWHFPRRVVTQRGKERVSVVVEGMQGGRAPKPSHQEQEVSLQEVLPELPEGWCLATMGQLTQFVTSGPRGWSRFYSNTGPTFIRAHDISTDRLRLQDAAHVTPPIGAEGIRTRVQAGDILVTITGANVTKTGVVEGDIGEAYVSQHVGLLRLVDQRLAWFLHCWMVSPLHGRAQLTDAAYGMGKPGLSLDNLRDLVVALPPLEEQHEIIRRVEVLFTLADRIEQRVATATARLDKLSQAILAKAFRGELVPTEAELARRDGREYEPAAVLLERIRAENMGCTRTPGPRKRLSHLQKRAGPTVQ